MLSAKKPSGEAGTRRPFRCMRQPEQRPSPLEIPLAALAVPNPLGPGYSGAGPAAVCRGGTRPDAIGSANGTSDRYAEWHAIRNRHCTRSVRREGIAGGRQDQAMTTAGHDAGCARDNRDITYRVFPTGSRDAGTSGTDIHFSGEVQFTEATR
jgi:hypothetical protein